MTWPTMLYAYRKVKKVAIESGSSADADAAADDYDEYY